MIENLFVVPRVPLPGLSPVDPKSTPSASKSRRAFDILSLITAVAFLIVRYFPVKTKWGWLTRPRPTTSERRLINNVNRLISIGSSLVGPLRPGNLLSVRYTLYPQLGTPSRRRPSSRPSSAGRRPPCRAPLGGAHHLGAGRERKDRRLHLKPVPDLVTNPHRDVDHTPHGLLWKVRQREGRGSSWWKVMHPESSPFWRSPRLSWSPSDVILHEEFTAGARGYMATGAYTK